MFADTTFTMKSGQYGTSMFSRSGKCTNYQYLCFNPLQDAQEDEPSLGQQADEGHRNQLLQEQEKQAMMNATNRSPTKMQDTVHPNTPVGTAFGHSKTLGDASMNKTKRSNAEASDVNKK